MKIMLIERFGHALRSRHKPSSLTIPIEIAQAGDQVADLFSIYKVLGADEVNKGYWPERKTFHPVENVHIVNPAVRLSLYHADMRTFAQYQLCRERNIEKLWIEQFQNDSDKIEIIISQPTDRLSYSVTTVIDSGKESKTCDSFDDVSVAVMSYVHQTSSPQILDHIHRFEQLWGFRKKQSDIALEM